MVQPGKSIQAAIERAEEGAIICLPAGTWEENLKIEKSLTLRGIGQQKTVIKGKEEGYPAVWISSMKRVAVKVEGLAIAGAGGECADWHKGICPDGLLIQGEAKVEITDSTISGNRRNGLSLWGSAWAAIIDSAISKNGHYGLWLWDSAQAEISDSTIAENGFGMDDELDSDRDGIMLRNSARMRITGSIISKNGHYGLWLSDSSQAEISGSTVSQNRHGGIWLRDGAQAGINGSTISENRDGIQLWGRARATIVGNQIIRNRGYGVALYHRPCYDTAEVFLGHVSGRANIISGPKELDGNSQRAVAVCPPELEFLMTEEGGEYP